MGKADIVQSYFPFVPISNLNVGFSCVGKISIYAHHNKKYVPKNPSLYVDVNKHSKVLEEAPDYRITSDLNIISTKGNCKIVRPYFDRELRVELRVGKNKPKRFSLNKLIQKYYPNVELKPQSHD
jgi:hypothetical protein